MNFYDILNVSHDASQNEIKNSFRKLSLKYHPDKDKSISSKNKYDDIMKAYTTLEDITKRKQYDASLQQLQPINNDLLSSQFKRNESPVDVIKSTNTSRLSFLTTNITITLEQAYNGCQFPVEIERFIYEEGCKTREREKIYIHIEPGIDNGEIIYIKNKGHEHLDGSMGDIKVYISVEDHNFFRRKGLDLFYNKSLTFEESMCGFSFNIFFLTETSLCIRNNPGDIVLNSSKKILRGKGMKRNNIIGNLIIEFSVIQPAKLKEDVVFAIRELIK